MSDTEIPKIEPNPSGAREKIYLAASASFVGFSLWLQSIGFLGQADWFQRSGAFLVVIGAICESKHIQKVLSPNVMALGAPLNRRQRFAVHSGFGIAIFGTLIWGYGDLIKLLL